MGAAEAGTYYGSHHVQTQVDGRGDGSDGLADNRAHALLPGEDQQQGRDDEPGHGQRLGARPGLPGLDESHQGRQ